MLFILLLTTFIFWLTIRHYYKTTRLPPGPISIPILGNLHQFIYYCWKYGGVVPAFDYFRKVYGNIHTIWMGPFPHVNITDYDMSQEAFIKNGNKYVDRFSPPIFKEFTGGLGLVFANGPIHAELRRFTFLTFRNMGVGRDIMEERILAEFVLRCAEIDKDAINGKTLVPTSEFFDLTVGSVINSVLVGKRFDETNKHEYLELKRLLDRGGEVFSIFDLTVPTWFLKKFFPKRFDLNQEVQQKITDFVSKEAIQRIEDYKSGKHTLDPERPNDLVDAFIIKMDKEDANGGHPAYAIEPMRHMLSDLWLAGHITTSNTMILALNLFVNNPSELAKVRQEILGVTGGTRLLSLQDRASTPYLVATLAEIQRHASVLNVNFWRHNYEMVTIGGHPVDKDTLICAQLAAMHINEEIFEDPQKFDPSRFIKNEKLLHQTIPFGIGKRSCVGENLARSELYLLTGNLVQRYDFKAHGGMPSLRDFLPFAAGRMPDKSATIEFIKL